MAHQKNRGDIDYWQIENQILYQMYQRNESHTVISKKSHSQKAGVIKCCLQTKVFVKAEVKQSAYYN